MTSYWPLNAISKTTMEVLASGRWSDDQSRLAALHPKTECRMPFSLSVMFPNFSFFSVRGSFCLVLHGASHFPFPFPLLSSLPSFPFSSLVFCSAFLLFYPSHAAFLLPSGHFLSLFLSPELDTLTPLSLFSMAILNEMTMPCVLPG